MRPSVRLLGAVLMVTSLAAVGRLAPVAFAADQNSIVATGWWWKAQTGVGPALPPPPNMNPGDVMVGADAEGANAIIAIEGQLAEGRVNPVLTLNLKPNGDTNGESASLIACHAGSAWTPAEAGTWGAAPDADCSVSVSGIRSDNGGSWTFPIGPLQFGDKFNIVIVPASELDGSVATFSLIFAAPAASNIETSPGTPPPPPTTAPPPPPTTPPPTAATGGQPPVTAPPPTFVAPTTPPPVAPALPADGQGLTATAPRFNQPPPAVTATPEATDTGSRTAARLGGLLAILAAVAGGYLAANGRLPLGAAGASPDTPVEGGLGRFRRVRDHEPASVS